ncbi:ubiquitin-like modifier protein, partial [Candida maltosa Xu316]
STASIDIATSSIDVGSNSIDIATNSVDIDSSSIDVGSRSVHIAISPATATTATGSTTAINSMVPWLTSRTVRMERIPLGNITNTQRSAPMIGRKATAKRNKPDKKTGLQIISYQFK